MNTENAFVSYNKKTKLHNKLSNQNNISTLICSSDPYKFRKSFLYSKNQVFQMDLIEQQQEDSEEIILIPKPHILTYIETTTQELNKISNLNLDI